MSTRGFCGFRIDEIDEIQYNHSDSYSSGLGAAVIEVVRGATDERLKQAARRTKLIDGHRKPTKTQIETCRKAGTINLEVGDQKETDWYCLLREAQGNLGYYTKDKDPLTIMLDGNHCPADSLEHEYGYIINCDTGMLEVYRGYNTTAHGNVLQDFGRYAKLRTKDISAPDGLSDCYGVVLVMEVPFPVIRSLSTDILVEVMEEQCALSKGNAPGNDDNTDPAVARAFRPLVFDEAHASELIAERVAAEMDKGEEGQA